MRVEIPHLQLTMCLQFADGSDMCCPDPSLSKASSPRIVRGLLAFSEVVAHWSKKHATAAVSFGRSRIRVILAAFTRNVAFHGSHTPQGAFFMRGFPDIPSREPMKARFYEGELWKRELEGVLLPMLDKYDVALVDDPDGHVRW